MLSACKTNQALMVFTVKPPFKVSCGSSGFEHLTKKNIKWKKFSTEITDPI
jgi:hypothetical protein